MNSIDNPDGQGTEKIIEKVKNTIKDFGLIASGDKIVVGLSGGADSMMLLHCLKFKLGYDVAACHINHNLRGAESDGDMQFVQETCEKYGVKLSLLSEDVTSYASIHGLSIEEAGRRVRYAFFTDTANEVSAQKIATAHTLSDSVETLLLNLTRGTGLKGLCGIPPFRDNIIRPLIQLTRTEIEQYCMENNISFVTDSSNADTAYTRNRIRKSVMPELLSVNPQTYASINRTISTLRQEQDFMEQQTLQAYENAAVEEGLVAEAVDGLHLALKKRVIAKFLEENKITLSNDLIMATADIISGKKSKINVRNGVFIACHKGIITIDDSSFISDYFEQELELGDFFNPCGKRYSISLVEKSETELIKKVYKKLSYIMLDYDKIIGKITLRQRKSGDKIKLFGRDGTRSIKKMFIDEKLTAAQKSQRLILADEKSVIAVEGYGACERVCVDGETKQVLVVICKQIQ